MSPLPDEHHRKRALTDLGASHAVRVTDYKTGKPPQAPERIVIGGGAELQRSPRMKSGFGPGADTNVVSRIIWVGQR